MNPHTTSPQTGGRRKPQAAPRHGYWAYTWLAVALLLAAYLGAAAPAQAGPPRPHPPGGGCARHDLRVTLTATPGAATYRAAGWLCQPPRHSNTIQVLLPGLTYTHRYWTGAGAGAGAGAGPGTDYVGTALAAGDAVYLLDRIGTGASDRPPADHVTVTSEAAATHQIIRALRDGTLGRFTRVVGVGHSFGSIVWMAEAATYGDVDALVLTGLLHDIRIDEMARFATDLYPAAADPKFTKTAPPDGYLTTRPGSRPRYFRDPRTAVNGAAGWDEQTKTTATTGELTFTLDDELAYSRAVTVPVLFVIGATDDLFCGTDQPCTTPADICRREHTAFPPSTRLAAATIPRTGHSINLHRTAPLAFAAMTTWLHRQRSAPAKPPVASCRR